MNDFYKRLKDERNELRDRIEKLQSFLENQWDHLGNNNKDGIVLLTKEFRLMEIQLYAMESYLAVLDERIVVVEIKLGITNE